MGRRRITPSDFDSDVAAAKELIREYDGANLHSFSDRELIDLIKIHYHTIKGRPVEGHRREQLYMIARRLLYEQAPAILRKAKALGIEATVLP